MTTPHQTGENKEGGAKGGHCGPKGGAKTTNLFLFHGLAPEPCKGWAPTPLAREVEGGAGTEGHGWAEAGACARACLAAPRRRLGGANAMHREHVVGECLGTQSYI